MKEGTSAICVQCDTEVFWYIHSEMGPIKAGAWTVVSPDSEEDPRYGTRCDTFRPHVVETDPT